MCLGMSFMAFKFSLKKIAGKDKGERKMRSLSQCVHTAGQKKKSLTNLNQFPLGVTNKIHAHLHNADISSCTSAYSDSY